MLAVEGIYENGNIRFMASPPYSGPSKVIVNFLDSDEQVARPGVDYSTFSFEKSKNILKDLKSSLAESILEERRG